MKCEGWPWHGDGSGGRSPALGSEPPVTASLKGHGPKGLCLSPSGAPEELSVLGVPEGRFPLYLHQFLTSPAWEGWAGLIPKILAMELEFSGT